MFQKFITTIIFSIVSSASFAAHASGLDSVGVFYKDEKVVILINEEQGAPRLQAFFNALEARDLLSKPPQTLDRYIFLSSDKTARIQCARADHAATCTFRFLPSELAQIANRRIEALIPAIEIFGTSAPAYADDFEMIFESSMKDRFKLKLSDEGLRIEGEKILASPAKP